MDAGVDVVPAVLVAAAAAWGELERHLSRSALAARTVAAYRRQARAYVAWLAEHAPEYPDAFTDRVGAEGAVTAWRRHLLQQRAAPASVNQALAAVELLYEQGPAIRIGVARARVARPGEPDALTDAQDAAVQRAADRRGVRDAAIIALLRYTGARVEEAARLDLVDVAITARTGTVRLHGKGDQVRVVPLPAPARDRVSAWIRHRPPTRGRPVTGPEHYTAAEQHADTAVELHNSDPVAAAFYLRLAGVHATLAVAAALHNGNQGDVSDNEQAWRESAAQLTTDIVHRTATPRKSHQNGSPPTSAPPT